MRQTTFFDDVKIAEDFLGFCQNENWADQFGEYLQSILRKDKRPTVLSLFSGAGGLDIGFYDAGFEIIETVEIEQTCNDTLRANFDKDRYFKSIKETFCVDIKDFQPGGRKVDFIIGGPPCQTFSAAGARAEGVAGTRDSRGNLFQEYVRILQQVKPKGFLFENVYRIVGANKGKDWHQIIDAFSKVGYSLFHRILDTADFGVAQHRERLIIVGLRNDISKTVSYRFPRPTHGPESTDNLPHYSSEKAISGLKNTNGFKPLSGKFGHLLEEIPPGLNYSFFTEKMGHPTPIFAWRSKFSDFLYKADPDRPVRTIKASGGQYTGPFHWENRPFTIDELKRLQSFPDAYLIVGNRSTAIKQIGNSVPPQFARILALSILDQVFSIALPFKLDYLSPNAELSFRKRKRELSEHYSSRASVSIDNLGLEVKPSLVPDAKFRFDIGNGFAYEPNDDGFFFATIENKKKQLLICVDNTDRSKKNEPEFDIVIKPHGKWCLAYSSIKLVSFLSGLEAYTAMWKTLDYLLFFHNIKADLVQLCGYYQYQPSFYQQLNVRKKSVFGDKSNCSILNAVCSGQIIRKPLSLEELSVFLNLKPDAIIDKMKLLKEIGYEVRSDNTNIALDQNTFLVPYAFPTLTPQSVQLKKKL